MTISSHGSCAKIYFINVACKDFVNFGSVFYTVSHINKYILLLFGVITG